MSITQLPPPETEPETSSIEYRMRAFFAGSIPLPPGINASYKPGSGLHQIVGTKSLHQFKLDAALLLTQGYHDWDLINAIRASKYKVPLKMNISFYLKSLWKRDVDGGVKAVMDAVFQRLELDDVLVVNLHVFKFEDPDNPRCDVEVFCDLSSH